MSRYAVIAAAILVGVLIGYVLSRPREAADETVYVEQNQRYWYLPWLGGIVVLIIGLLLLADPTRAPKNSDYAPAVIKDGEIQPGQFNPKKEN
jgi:uncharacterized membrane-anchored protein YhcB (DUF1043 family)